MTSIAAQKYLTDLFTQNRVILLIFTSIFILSGYGNLSARTISDIRQGKHDQSDRIVIELNQKTDYYIHRSNQNTILIDIYDIENPYSLSKSNTLIEWINDWKGEYYSDHNIYRLYLKTKDHDVKWNDLILTQPHRIVIDFSRDGKTNESSDPPPVVEITDSSSYQPSTPGVFRPRTIIIDPGHGGHHRGGVGKANGKRVTEADVTPPIGRYLNELLSQDPRFNPQVTRTTDTYVGLRERTALAEKWEGNLFISIHYNSIPAGKNPYSARGLEFWTWSPKRSTSTAEKYLTRLNNEEGTEAEVGNPTGSTKQVLSQMVGDALLAQATESTHLAEAMEDAFLQDSYFKKHYRGIKSARFKVLENYNMPSVLLEVGFLSHPEEAKLSLQTSFQKKVAQYTYEGIVNYYMKHDPEFRLVDPGTIAKN